MKRQLQFAVKLFTFAGVYLFTRSTTPKHKIRDPDISIAVVFLLETLKRFWLYNTRLIRNTKHQVELLDYDVRLFKAFLIDSAKIKNKSEAMEEFVGQINDVVVEAEGLVLGFLNHETEIRARNFFQRAFCGSTKLISVAKEVSVMKAKVKKIYGKSNVIKATK